jgi:hypothetical protein
MGVDLEIVKGELPTSFETKNPARFEAGRVRQDFNW